MSEIPQETLHQLYRAYCLDKHPYAPDGWINEEARQSRIDYDARSYYEKCTNAAECAEWCGRCGHVGALARLVEAAIAAGRESAYTTDDPKIKATKYTVAGYPEADSINAYLYDVDVEYRGKGRWAVCWMGRCYDKAGVEDYEPTPSSREDDWLDRYRFDTADDAIAVAKKVAATLTVNGMTAAQCWEWEQARQKEIEAWERQAGAVADA